MHIIPRSGVKVGVPFSTLSSISLVRILDLLYFLIYFTNDRNQVLILGGNSMVFSLLGDALLGCGSECDL